MPFAELSLRTLTIQASCLLSYSMPGASSARCYRIVSAISLAVLLFLMELCPQLSLYFPGWQHRMCQASQHGAYRRVTWSLHRQQVTSLTLPLSFSSGIVDSITNAIASLLSNPSNTGLRIGFIWTADAFAELVGTPIAGALIRRTGHELQKVSYVEGQILGGANIAPGAAFPVVPAWSIFRDKNTKASRSAKLSGEALEIGEYSLPLRTYHSMSSATSSVSHLDTCSMRQLFHGSMFQTFSKPNTKSLRHIVSHHNAAKLSPSYKFGD